MSLRQKIKLELDEGGATRELVVTYDGRDLRGWETKHRRSALVETMSLDMLTWLGWSAGRRSGDLNGAYEKYEEFDKVCVSVEGLPDEEEPEEEVLPTQAQSKARTPRSRGAASSAH